jgi:hypothetical protein
MQNGIATLAILLALSACGQTVRPNAVPVKPTNTLSQWPRASVAVNVQDFRTDKGPESASVTSAVKESIEAALSDSGSSDRRYDFTVLVSEYRGFFTMGHWNGIAKLKAALTDAQGATVKEWSAEGQTRKMNMWGKATANAVAREALRSAITDLTAQLALSPLPR